MSSILTIDICVAAKVNTALSNSCRLAPLRKCCIPQFTLTCAPIGVTGHTAIIGVRWYAELCVGVL